jgi:aspartate aminotransferase-like enzyme
MSIREISYELIQCEYKGKDLDFDRYNVEVKTPMSTQEFSVVVDHVDKELSGDCIRYGSWGDIEQDEILEILEAVEAAGELRRPYKEYIK